MNKDRNVKRRGYLFGLEVLRLTDKFPNKRSAWTVGGQLSGSATSVGANMVEAKSASSILEFKRFYEIALRSANETKYWLCMARDVNLLSKNNALRLVNEIEEIAKMIALSVLKIKKSI